jgi:hypothetical protein
MNSFPHLFAQKRAYILNIEVDEPMIPCTTKRFFIGHYGIKMYIMKIIWKILISILVLASVALVVINRLSHIVEPNAMGQSIQINQGFVNDSLPPVSNPVLEKVFVGPIKSNRYHCPSCNAAKRIKPETRSGSLIQKMLGLMAMYLAKYVIRHEHSLTCNLVIFL